MVELDEIIDIPKFLESIPEYRIEEPHHPYLRLWYRGEADNSWELKPKRFRREFGHPEGLDGLKVERHLAQDFKVLSADLRTVEEDADLYFLQQHYGMPTRLLDWTTNPLAALFFAVNKDPNKNGRLFRMNAYELSGKQGLSKLLVTDQNYFEGIATSRHPKFDADLKSIIRFGGEPPLGYILPVRPNYSDKRITLQRSCFTFHGYKRETITSREADLKFHLIRASAKAGILKHLSFLGIDDFSVYGDLEGLQRTLQYRYNTNRL